MNNQEIIESLVASYPKVTQQAKFGEHKIPNYQGIYSHLFELLLTGNIPENIPLKDSWAQNVLAKISTSQTFPQLVQYTLNKEEYSFAATYQLCKSINSVLAGGNNWEGESREQLEKRSISAKGTFWEGKINKQLRATDSKLTRISRRLGAYNYSPVIDRIISSFNELHNGNYAISQMPGVTRNTPSHEKIAIFNTFSTSEAKKILQQLGRMRQTFKSISKLKKSIEVLKVSGIEYGNYIPDLLPEELLKDDDQFILEFAEEKLSQYGSLAVPKDEKSAQGDVVVLLDVSTSMREMIPGTNASRLTWAKSLICFLFEIAVKQKRKFCVIPFNNTPSEEIVIKSVTDLEEIIEYSARGGTSIPRALLGGIEAAKKQKSDILLITDGEEYIYEKFLIDTKQKLDKGNIRLQSVVIIDYKTTCMEPLNRLGSLSILSNVTDEQKTLQLPVIENKN